MMIRILTILMKMLKKHQCWHLPDLSGDNVETKVYTSTVSQEMNAKIEKLESQKGDLCGKLSNVDDIMERLTKLEEKN